MHPIAAILTFAACPALALQLPTQLAGQTPSVLDLQKSYHVGIYGGSIEVPGGSLRLLAQFGDMTLAANGDLAGALDTHEVTTAGSTFTPNDPFSATYIVRPDGQIVLDTDPANPGTELIGLWIDVDGTVLHSARAQANPDAQSVLAIEKSTGMGSSSLSGSYYFVNQRMEFVGSDWHTFSDWGIATFDGSGGGTVVGSALTATPTGSTSQPFAGTFSYTVANDGSLVLDGSDGAMTQDGEMLFVVESDTSSGEVGMTIAVRLGTSYDLRDLTYRYGLTGQGYTLGTGATMPQSATNYGELQLTAATASTGSWSLKGIVVYGTPQGVLINPLTGAGAASLAAVGGTLTLSDPAGSADLGFSATGRYFVGRANAPTTELLFGMRQCAASASYGSGTAGTGGAVPRLGMKTFPVINNSGWRFAVSQGVGGSIGALAVGFAPLPGIPALGGLIWVAPQSVGYTPLLLLGGASGSAATGSAEAALPIPNNPTLAGVSLFAQALILDGGGPSGFAMSNGFEATICR